MIRDKTSQGYIIADTLANLKLSKRFDDKTLQAFYEVATAHLKQWEALAVKETYQQLLKERTKSL